MLNFVNLQMQIYIIFVYKKGRYSLQFGLHLRLLYLIFGNIGQNVGF